VLATALLSACGRDAEGSPGDHRGAPKPGATSFISSPPEEEERHTDGGPIAAAGGGTNGDNGDASTKNDPGRLIAEADVIKLDGSKLYALSRYSGLSIIDVEDPARLVLLGTYKAGGVPFEMYVEGERAYVMYNEYEIYRLHEASGDFEYGVSSRVEAVDVSDAHLPKLLGAHNLPGTISDSRKVGDVLYLVAHEDGSCWQCVDRMPNTHVASFDVSSPDEFVPIDEVRIGGEENVRYSQRSVAVTEKRIYISGQDWGGGDYGVADVVDISDPSGNLELGARFRLAGPVKSRWQMDEHNGVLRAVTQPGSSRSTEPPMLETFEVVSSSEITQLSSLEVKLPRPEELRSVRFDGDRAFAITFEQTDPLFTFDLSDPAAPRQLGELEIPGWLYHMEPRGDRLYALGFERGNEGGALHASLFDISELSAPKQLARVNFGGSLANFAEDQDRIHKAFNIMPEEGLMLVPYAGRDASAQDECLSVSYQSGIQLVDVTEDTLELRGVAPQVGEARRGFLAQGVLFAVSDNAVQTFDISERDAPRALDTLETARNVSGTRAVGDTLLRFGSDWWKARAVLDFVSLTDVEAAEPLGELDLSVVASPEVTCERHVYWEGNVYVQGDYAYVPQRLYAVSGGTKRQVMRFLVVDLSDSSALRLVGSFSVSTTESEGQLRGVSLTKSALLVARTRGGYAFDEQTKKPIPPTLVYDVFSLADPAHPMLAASLEVPQTLSVGGFGQNLSTARIDLGFGFWVGNSRRALVSGDIVATQHYVPLEEGSRRGRYFLDRVDVSDPANPRLLPEVNIPGSLLDFDADQGLIVTLDHELRPDETEALGCRFRRNEAGECERSIRSVNTLKLSGDVATLQNRIEVDGEENGVTYSARDVAVGGDRVFVTRHSQDGQSSNRSLQVFSPSGSGALEDLGSIPLSQSESGALFARGGRGFLVSDDHVLEVDARVPGELKSWEYAIDGYCEGFEPTDTHVYCALGYGGVRQIELLP
jgi:hypothetical protein